jgi:hypothetical protein
MIEIMATETSNIPRSIKGYNTFINVTTPYLTTGVPEKYQQFGWTAANLSFWQAQQTAWNLLYPSYLNRKGAYTTDIKNDLKNIIKNTLAYDKTNKLILKVKSTTGLTSLDCSNFNIPQTYSAPVSGLHPEVEKKVKEKTIITEESVYPKIIPIGGGILHIKAYLEKVQSGRPHKPEGYDELEYAIGVFYYTATGLPVSPDDPRLTKDYSTKSNFKLLTSAIASNLTAIAAGSATPLKVAVIFFRWAKSKHPTLDGPWSVAFTTPVL